MNESKHPKLNKKNWTILRKEQYKLLKIFLDNCADGTKVLDIGSGPSPFRDLYSRFNLTSVDWQKQEIVDVVADLDDTLPFDNDIFDIITSTNTFEHLYTDKAIFDSIRILKKGGWIIGTTPFLLAVHQAPHDYYRFTKFALERKLKDAGYLNIKVVELGSAYDVVWHNTRQMFMKGFDQNPVMAKISWNVLKMYWFIFGKFLSKIENKNMSLGYMFYAQK